MESDREDRDPSGLVAALESSVGYVLKQAATALRASMEEALRPLDLTVSQYACLELLHQRDGLSNADLARAAFVTRQSMNLVLRGLQNRGLVARADLADQGRSRPARLTPEGARLHRLASAAVRTVERRMLASLGPGDAERLCRDLTGCVRSLEADGVPES